MKKIIVLTLIFVVLSNCEIKPRETAAQEPKREIILTPDIKDIRGTGIDYNYSSFQYHTETHEEMTYGIWTTSNYHGATTTVVNLTKEQLEVELLKLQISKLHQELHNNP